MSLFPGEECARQGHVIIEYGMQDVRLMETMINVLLDEISSRRKKHFHYKVTPLVDKTPGYLIESW